MNAEDINREAWRLLLDCAEGGVEDAMNEDPDAGWTDEEFDDIRDRALELIREQREAHGVTE